MVEINVRSVAPELVLQFAARNCFASLAEKIEQDLKRLAGKMNTDSILPQLLPSLDYFEGRKRKYCFRCLIKVQFRLRLELTIPRFSTPSERSIALKTSSRQGV